MSGALTRGVLFVHSAPRALCPHIEWAAGGVVGIRLSLEWIDQPASPGTLRTEFSWQGAQGTGARLASALRGWAHLRYEVTEEPSPGVTDHATPVGTHHDLRTRSGSLHSVSAFLGGRSGPSTSQIIPDRKALPHS